VIELSLKEGVIDEYVAAYSVNHHDFSDPIYTTWKLYKDKCLHCGSVDKYNGAADEKVTSVQQVIRIRAIGVIYSANDECSIICFISGSDSDCDVTIAGGLQPYMYEPAADSSASCTTPTAVGFTAGRTVKPVNQ